MKLDRVVESNLLRFGISMVAILLVTAILVTLGTHVNLITVSMSLLLVVLASATFFGRNPALLASFVAMLCFNYVFIPPIGTWHIADSQNLFAWAAFTLTAIIAGELSAYARRRAREAERLYEELQKAFQDATEAAALKQSEKLKSALLDAVTHDLRTPLTSIKASVTTLLDSEGGHRTIELNSEGRAEFLDIINEETDRLNGFIESMVQLARVEAGTKGASAAFSNVEEIVTIALERAETIAAEHHLTVNLQEGLPLIRVDARAIAEVVYNLIENAVKYSASQTTITITAIQQADRVFISVTDEGKGIPPEMREKVFEKFVRLDTGHSDGLGLGLAIARGIVEAQGGRIEIKTGDNGIGTTVTLMLQIGEL
ncbi:MAG: DUF4118 domain-containing protein [Pyrinomonadaceae bacterium]|nr:DUF4118 domain-containing protein [Pyrinomonadaceae bacterium]